MLVLVVALPLLAGSQTPFGTFNAIPAGASLAAPQQRTGTADGSSHDASAESTRGTHALAARDQPRPAGAVADQAPPLPEAKKPSSDERHVKPALSQTSALPAVDPGATERPQDRTADTQTFDNPDGSRTLRLHTGQANVRQEDGSWKPVDLTLGESGGRVKPGNSPADVTFAPHGDDAALVRYTADADHKVSYSLRDAANVRGELHDAEITYRGVRPDTDLRLTATRDGLKEELVLSGPGAPASSTFNLTLDRMQPRVTVAGDVELTDGDRVVATIPAGFMDDAKGVRSTGVRYAVEKTGDRTWNLRLDLDESWLRDPARAFPVTVDPSVGQYLTATDDTYVQKNSPSGHSSEAVLIAGNVGDGGGIGRAYLHFPSLGAISGKYVIGASLGLNNADASCASYSFTAFEVTQPWNTGIRWPGAAVGQALGTAALGSCANNRWGFIPISGDVMTRWTHGLAVPHGLSVRASNETNGTGHRFASANAANAPYLDVRYADEGASFEVTDVLLPTNNRAGNLKAKVTNLGSKTWTPSSGHQFGYIVRQGATTIRTSKYGYPTTTGPMQTGTVDVPIDSLAPGDYQLDLTMFASGADFRQAYEVPYGRIDLKVENLWPTSNMQQPGSGAVVESLKPTLYAEGVDTDNWPGKGLTYKFRICSNADLTENCQESGWTGQSWTPEPLRWGKSYFWGVKVYDTVTPTPDWDVKLAITTRVPQPQITSHLAGNPFSVQGPGLDAGIGNYSTVVTDASVATAGPDLTITRTYNSLDPRRDTAFGVGWASRLDMRLKADDDRSGNVVVTFPSGRQIRFGKNPDASYGSPLGDSTELVYSTATGRYTLRDNSGSRWVFDVLGRLGDVIDPAGLVQHLEYDTGDRVTTITSDTSERTLSFTWDGKHVKTISTEAPDAGGQPLVWTYTYTGDKLTSACVPGVAPNCTTYDHTSGSHYRSSVIDNNPKAYWRFGETSGDTVANAVARRPGDNQAVQHGVILGTDGALSGTVDKAATFDGNSSYLTLPEKLTTSTMSLAVELWFKTTAQGTLLSYADQSFPASPGKSTPVLYVGTDGLLYGGFSLRDNGGDRQISTTAQVDDGQWHHVVLSAAIDSQSMYLDGTKVGDLAGFLDHKQQGKLTLGAGQAKDWPATNGGDFYFDGSIDEVALYQHPLGSLAVSQHFGARSAIDQLTGVKLPQDNRQFVKLTYDDVNDRVKTMVDNEGRTWTMDVPKVQDSTRTTVLRGPGGYGDWTYVSDIDNGGRLTSLAHKGRTRKVEYNTAGFRSALVDENGRRFEQTTDERGNTLSSKSCRAPGSCNTTYHTYVQSGDPLDPRRDKLESTSDARSSGPDDTRYRTTYQYDTAGRLTRTTFPTPEGLSAAPAEVLSYSTGFEGAVGGGTVPAGLLVKTTGRRGQETFHSYRSNGDLVETRSPTGLVTRYEFDGIGRRKSVTTANGGGAVFGTTRYEYSPRSLISKITEPAVLNQLTGVTHTKVTTNSYDGNGNLIETTVADQAQSGQGGDAARTTSFTYDASDRLASTVFPDGGRETREYRDDALTEVVTDVRGFVWATHHDEDGRVMSRDISGTGVDPQNPGATNLAIEYSAYDPAGQLSSTTDAMGRTTRFTYYDDGLPATTTLEGCLGENGPCDVELDRRTYDPAGNVVEQSVAGGRRSVQAFDAAGFLTGTTFDPDGLRRAKTFRRDADGNITRIEARGAADPNRVESSNYEYDADGLVTREDAFLNTGTALSSTMVRDERGLVVSSTDRRQLTTKFRYDANGEAFETTRPATEVWVDGVRTPNFAGVETLGRNTFGEVTHSRNSAGATSTTERDSMGRATAGVLPAYTTPGGNPVTSRSVTEYDHAGNAVKFTDPLGRITTHTYDPYGRTLTSTLPRVGSAPSVVSHRYDRLGELLAQVDAAGGETRYTYDELGRRITSTEVDRSSGVFAFYTTTTAYDLADNPVSVTTPQGFTTKHTHNRAGELLSATDPTGRVTGYDYDIAGRTVAVTEPSGVVSSTVYDLLGRPTDARQLVGGEQKRTSSTVYDANGNVTGATTAEGRSVTYAYDEVNRLRQQVEKVDGTKSITTSFGYDKLGNRSRFVDGNGRETRYTYNSWGRSESTVEPSTSTTPALADRTWTASYDAAGRQVEVVKPGGVTLTREFDDQDRLTVEHGGGAEAATADRTLGYDRAGRVTRVGGPGGDSTYRYDDRGNLLESTGPAGAATYTYNADRTLASRTDTAGTATFGYDQAGRLTSASDPLTGRTVDYAYDTAGRLSTVSDRAVAGKVTRRIGYDALGRKTSDQLQQVIDSGLPPRVVLGTDYGYDKDDRVTSKTVTSNVGKVGSTYAYDGAGRLTSWTDSANNTTSYGWDDAGNRTSAGAETFAYDERNRLKSGGGATYTYTARGTLSSTTQNGQTANAAFDAFDRMASNGAVKYRYDAMDRVSDRNGTQFQYTGLTNEAVSDGSRKITRLPDGTALSDKSTTGTGRMTFADQHGDVIGRYLGSGTDGLRSFDPFGKVLSSSGDASPLGYQGDWTDGTTGAVNMSARWYSPNAARFVSRDDWNVSPKPSIAANRFAYGNGDPMSNADPSGHLCGPAAPVCLGAGAGAAVGGPPGAVIGGVVGGVVTVGVAIWYFSGDTETSFVHRPIRFEPRPKPTPNPKPDPSPNPDPNPKCAPNCGGGQPPKCVVNCTPKPPVFVPPAPPPPPIWWINAMRKMVRPGAGSTVVGAAAQVAAATAATEILNLGWKYVEDERDVTEADGADDPRPPGTTNPNDDDFCGDLGMAENRPYYGPMDPTSFKGKYKGRPRTGPAMRATGAAVCLTAINPDDRLTPLEPAGYSRKEGHVKGHLVAHMFWGSNRRDNMVPLYDRVNNPDMLGIELTVRDQVKDAKEKIYYQVVPEYADESDPQPYMISIRAYGNKGFTCEVDVFNIEEGSVVAPTC
ncbi:LamG-like jellyroll fold domain-containing protein [Lentzea sp.]|uniref:LamG-like jellyroll fold domain-containing protein n=1 Tax=Lentzea sp. TaxID=56099 RepID=UPI002ED69545